ncbi:hypothetical protein E2F48_08595 [Arthrobacter crusticola]|uniref:Uncharacterized protein n=1 Tax=Arthrobacter crusticola TaxID=2547960 RepID=A0A4R5TW12_9MICC|nr:hypothetical protein [Arthrobacter crusticola]TDK25325.1 hypothetical protein E2F48_08595 [Arthrobacter crusticola]
MESETTYGVEPGEGFYAWPRPLPPPALRVLKKGLLLAAALLTVHQFIPAGSAGSLVSEVFTIALVMSWLAPLGRMYTRLAGRRGDRSG